MEDYTCILKMKLDAALTRANAFHGQIRLILDDPTLTDAEKLEAIDELLRAEDGK